MNSVLSSKKNLLVFIFILSFLFSLVAGISYAQEKYPSRSIDLVIVFAPGGTNDALGRIFADELSKVLNVSVTPINKVGATGTVGAAYVAKVKKDGYTLLAGAGSGMTLAPRMLPNIPFETLRDFFPVSIMGTSPTIIFVKKDSPFKSFEDLMDYAKKNPEKLTYGTAGTGSDNHFFMEQMQIYGKMKVSHIPYKGGSEVLPAVLGGHVDFGVSLMATVINQLRAGEVRCLIISEKKRLSTFPNIPTALEKGYDQHFIGHWTGLFTPAGTPQSVLDILIKASNRIIKLENFIKKVEDIGCAVKDLSPAEFRNFIAEEERVATIIAKEIRDKTKK